MGICDGTITTYIKDDDWRKYYLAKLNGETKENKILDDILKQKGNDSKSDAFSYDAKFSSDAIKTLKIISKEGLSKKSIRLTRGFSKKLREDFDLTDVEYLILSIFCAKMSVLLSPDMIISIAGASEAILPDVYKTLFSLFRKKLVDVHQAVGGVTFTASIYLEEYSRLGDKKKYPPKNLRFIVKEVDAIANLFNVVRPFPEIAKNEIRWLLNQYDYPFCKEMLRIDQEIYESAFVWYIICHLALSGEDIDKDSELIYMWVRVDPTRERVIDSIFAKGYSKVFSEKIFDHVVDEGGKTDKNLIEIHADFKRKFLQGVIRERTHENVIKSDDITKKTLFFNSKTGEKTDELRGLLSQKTFRDVKQRLKENGTRTGFACLFSGLPGTGKTEFALQIARETGRDIMKVDMSSLRSKWWGEDEKNVKWIFSNYKAALVDSKIEPILLLNEADAIIGKRLDVTGNNGAIITSINAVQNIILDELENFEGILIATTNLTQNFDSAFERRFIYKIDFEKPDTEARTNIIAEVLKINYDWAKKLALEFDLTGAQVENVYRKSVTKRVLYGRESSFEEFYSLCKDELKNEQKIIGFR